MKKEKTEKNKKKKKKKKKRRASRRGSLELDRTRHLKPDRRS